VFLLKMMIPYACHYYTWLFSEMKSAKTVLSYNPFENLRKMIQESSVDPTLHLCDNRTVPVGDGAEPQEEEELFQKAMEGITPIGRDGIAATRSENRSDDTLGTCGDDEVISHLENLINTGQGFIVAETPEYVEGTGYCVRRDAAKRLHRGEFSIQSHVDLHGLTVEEAKNAFERFLKDNVMAGKRAVLIIHGRGRSSPSEPVIKNKVIEWLSSGPWHKWVMAFSSARSCDGGAGATYVLLRERSLTKRFRRLVAKDKRGNK